MNPKKFPMPTGMLLKTDDEEKFLPFQNPTTYKDITVELKPNGEALRVYVTADTSPVQRVTLYFADPLPEKAQVLGGVWERGYGDYEWRGYVPHRVMPWYFFLQSGNKTEAFGVHTQPAAMCWWTAESTGYSVYLDVRCGGLGVRLNGRTLCAAELCRAEYEDADGFTAMGEFFSVLSPNPILPKSPVYGANNWYHAYGHATEDDVLREAKALAELTEGLANRPWFIIDDCWQIDRADNYNGGPWRAGNKGFPDMPDLAKKLRESGIQPGIWVRLLWDHSESIPASWRSKRDPEYLDPSVPEVLDACAEVDGACGVIGRHENRAEQEAAGKNIHQRIAAEQCGKHRCRCKVRDRDNRADNAACNKVNAAENECECTGLAEAAARVAEKHIEVTRQRRTRALGENAERRCGRHGIGEAVVHRRRPRGHFCRERVHQNDTRRQRGVHEVLSDAAEHLLYDNNSNDAAERRNDGADGNGQVHREQNARHNAGKVTDRLAALHDAAGYVFAQNAGRDRCQDNNRRAEAENDNGCNHRRSQRQNDVQHQGLGGVF